MAAPVLTGSPFEVVEGGLSESSGSGPCPLPNNIPFCNDPTLAGIFGICQSIDNAIFPHRKPVPNPKPIIRPQYNNKCPDLYAKMKAVCNQQSSCRDIPSTDCTQLRHNYQLSANCSLLRSEIILACDFNFAPNWKTNWCMHEREMCRADYSACKCAEKGSGCNPPVGSRQACANLRKGCEAMQVRCGGSTKDFWS